MNILNLRALGNSEAIISQLGHKSGTTRFEIGRLNFTREVFKYLRAIAEWSIGWSYEIAKKMPVNGDVLLVFSSNQGIPPLIHSLPPNCACIVKWLRFLILGYPPWEVPLPSKNAFSLTKPGERMIMNKFHNSSSALI